MPWARVAALLVGAVFVIAWLNLRYVQCGCPQQPSHTARHGVMVSGSRVCMPTSSDFTLAQPKRVQHTTAAPWWRVGPRASAGTDAGGHPAAAVVMLS